jgi:hypothetical protein
MREARDGFPPDASRARTWTAPSAPLTCLATSLTARAGTNRGPSETRNPASTGTRATPSRYESVATTSRVAGSSSKNRATHVSTGRDSSSDAHRATRSNASVAAEASIEAMGSITATRGTAGQSSVGQPWSVTVRLPARTSSATRPSLECDSSTISGSLIAATALTRAFRNHDRARSVDRHITTDDASGGEFQIRRLDGHLAIRGLQANAGEHGEPRSSGNCREHRLQFGGERLCRHHQLHVNLLRSSRERRSPRDGSDRSLSV